MAQERQEILPPAATVDFTVEEPNQFLRVGETRLQVFGLSPGGYLKAVAARTARLDKKDSDSETQFLRIVDGTEARETKETLEALQAKANKAIQETADNFIPVIDRDFLAAELDSDYQNRFNISDADLSKTKNPITEAPYTRDEWEAGMGDWKEGEEARRGIVIDPFVAAGGALAQILGAITGNREVAMAAPFVAEEERARRQLMSQDASVRRLQQEFSVENTKVKIALQDVAEAGALYRDRLQTQDRAINAVYDNNEAMKRIKLQIRTNDITNAGNGLDVTRQNLPALPPQEIQRAIANYNSQVESYNALNPTLKKDPITQEELDGMVGSSSNAARSQAVVSAVEVYTNVFGNRMLGIPVVGTPEWTKFAKEVDETLGVIQWYDPISRKYESVTMKDIAGLVPRHPTDQIKLAQQGLGLEDRRADQVDSRNAQVKRIEDAKLKILQAQEKRDKEGITSGGSFGDIVSMLNKAKDWVSNPADLAVRAGAKKAFSDATAKSLDDQNNLAVNISRFNSKYAGKSDSSGTDVEHPTEKRKMTVKELRERIVTMGDGVNSVNAGILVAGETLNELELQITNDAKALLGAMGINLPLGTLQPYIPDRRFQFTQVHRKKDGTLVIIRTERLGRAIPPSLLLDLDKVETEILEDGSIWIKNLENKDK